MCSLYVILLSLPLCQTILHQPRTGKGDDIYIERFRRSKQMIDIGEAALRFLLKGAKKSKTQKEGFTMYTKGGTRKTAYREFMDSVTEPEGVMHYKNLFGRRAVLGGAGDRLIYYTPSDLHVGNKPSITIQDPKKAWLGESSLDKIIYE